MDATLFSTFIVVFREALEASLIVGIILTVLSRLGQTAYYKHVWGSVIAGLIASILVGQWILGLDTASQDQWGRAIEGAISLAACAVLTYMVVWMHNQAKKIKPEIETKIEQAVDSGEYFTMISMPFLAIFREGAETVLFLKAISIQGSAAISFWGCIFGIVLGVASVSILFIGGKKVPLRPLFSGTSFLLVFIAAGLLAYGIHELQEISWIPIIKYPVWNINPILNEKVGIGAFLKTLFGYNGNPSLIEVVMYSSYLLGSFIYLNKDRKKSLHGR